VAELLGDGTQDYDPHPALFEFSLDTLRKLAAGGEVMGLVSAYELGWLGELGLRPVLDRCAACQAVGLPPGRLVYSAIAGGLVCPNCAPAQRDRRSVSRAALDTLEELSSGELPAVSTEVRQLLGHTVSTVLGRRPRLLGYLT
jgi:DNA repair protein RecO (recombination protein O)